MGRMWSVSAVRDVKVGGRDHVGRNEEHAKQRDSRGTLKRLVPAQIRGERPLQLERGSPRASSWTPSQRERLLTHERPPGHKRRANCRYFKIVLRRA